MDADVIIAGAGIAGVATAYHLTVGLGVRDVVICDPGPPLSMTSDKSTECYRNWWPGPGDAMVSFMNRSIDLLEGWATMSGDVFNLSRRGYLYLTADPGILEPMRRQAVEISGLGGGEVRSHSGSRVGGYVPWDPADRDPPGGADLFDAAAVQAAFPFVSDRAVGGLHARRGGWFSAQQLGTWLLEQAIAHGATLVPRAVTSVETSFGQVSKVLTDGDSIASNVFVNATGPFVSQVGEMVGVDLPVRSEIHRKMSFHDTRGAVPRTAPMLIWNDSQQLDWDDEERTMLRADPDLEELVGSLAAGAHCRPDGGEDSDVVLGLWEYRTDVIEPVFPIPEDPMYPEMVVRGLATMLPGMAGYIERLPQPYVDGGYYTKAPENRPLIGPVGPEGSYVVGALSGYGVMAAPAAGELVARHVVGAELPTYAGAMLASRFDDPAYLAAFEGLDPGQL
jgi:glycine/D-amino acid oxidase-like deaminating enzyme